ncbi:MAG: hypothetical protein V5A32_08970 [Halovenus sp.]
MYNFAPAAEDERIVFGACRPNHPRRTPSDSSVNDWVRYMQDRDVERVCCLLDETPLSEYDGLLDTYAAAFGADRVTHPDRGFQRRRSADAPRDDPAVSRRVERRLGASRRPLFGGVGTNGTRTGALAGARPRL